MISTDQIKELEKIHKTLQNEDNFLIRIWTERDGLYYELDKPGISKEEYEAIAKKVRHNILLDEKWGVSDPM